jgi:hypothetical protein
MLGQLALERAPSLDVEGAVDRLVGEAHRLIVGVFDSKPTGDLLGGVVVAKALLGTDVSLRPVYTAPTEAGAKERFVEFTTIWGERYPGIIRLWENAWAEFVPFLAFEVEVRRVIFSTNAVESLNARFRRAIQARGHFPTDQAALKCLYLTLRSLDPTGRGRTV